MAAMLTMNAVLLPDVLPLKDDQDAPFLRQVSLYYVQGSLHHDQGSLAHAQGSLSHVQGPLAHALGLLCHQRGLLSLCQEHQELRDEGTSEERRSKKENKTPQH